MPSIQFLNFSGESVEIDLSKKTPAEALAIGSKHLDEGLKKRQQVNKYKKLMIFQIDLIRDNCFIETGKIYRGENCEIENEIKEVENDLEKFYKLFFEVMSDLSGDLMADFIAIQKKLTN